MSIWTLTSPQPLTSSLKSSAVKSSRAFLGSTSSKPFLIAYIKQEIITQNTHFSVLRNHIKESTGIQLVYLHEEAAQQQQAFGAQRTS